jgi:hypothetical protein
MESCDSMPTSVEPTCITKVVLSLRRVCIRVEESDAATREEQMRNRCYFRSGRFFCRPFTLPLLPLQAATYLCDSELALVLVPPDNEIEEGREHHLDAASASSANTALDAAVVSDRVEAVHTGT